MTRTRTPLGRWWLYAILTVAFVAVVYVVVGDPGDEKAEPVVL